MSDELTTAERRDLSPLQVFFLKVAIVTAAILVVLYCAGYFLQSFVAAKADQMTFLKGGPVFWAQMEQKLYSFADQPDMPPEKRQKIIDALRKISIRYKPFIDALDGADRPAEPKGR